MKRLNKYYLKLTTLSPVHIGTGDVYEPTNFVIDDGWLYEFDETLFYKSLNDPDRKSFNSKINDWMKIIGFYKNHTKEAKKIYENKTPITKKVEEKYKTTINKDGTKNKNQFEIHKTFKNPNTYRAIIPGSSIKGMFDTVFKIYSKPEVASNEVRQELIISDALLINGKTQIGYSYRKHKNPSKSARSSIPQMVEIIKKDSTFILSISTTKSFEDIKQAMKRYHQERKNSKYQEGANSFTVRVGKYVGKEYIVDDGKNVKNSFEKPIATHTLYEDNSPFGWVMFEEISFEEYQEGLKTISIQEEYFYHDREKRQNEIKQAIKKVEEEAKEKALQKQKAKEEEEQRLKKEQEEKEAKINSMSPLERKIEHLKQTDSNIPQNTLIFNSIKNGALDEFRCEAIILLKKLMIDNNEWKETTNAKKPEKDKKFKRTQEVITMLKECD